MKINIAGMFLSLFFMHFFIPTGTLLVAKHGMNKTDESFLNELSKDEWRARQDNDWLFAALKEMSPSDYCQPVAASSMPYQQLFCPPGKILWQFSLLMKIAVWTMTVAFVVIFLIILLAGLMLIKPLGQYHILISLRPLLIAIGLIGSLVQLISVAWLCWSDFILTGNGWLSGLLLLAMIMVTRHFLYIARSSCCSPAQDDLDGELLERDRAPALWQRVERLAQQIGTRPPDHIVIGAGMDFYVTEAPLYVGWRPLYGRKLFISIPLLRQLSRVQTDGVILHELTHFHLGHTAASALMEPEIERTERLLRQMVGRVTMLVPFFLLKFYHTLVVLAWRRYRRQCEFVADRTAASQVPAAALIEALIKILAWRGFQQAMEQPAFTSMNRRPPSWKIGVPHAAQFAEYIHSPLFSQIFSRSRHRARDLHPSVSERMRNLRYQIAASDYAAVVLSPPSECWLALIPDAAALAQRLWEQRHFRAVPEQHRQQDGTHDLEAAKGVAG